MRKTVCLILAALLVCAFSLSACAPPDKLRTVRVAYACKPELDDDTPDSAIGYVEHKIVDAPGERMYFLTLQLALYSPDAKGLVSPFPDNTIIRGVKVDAEGIANVTYTDNYCTLDGMSRTLAELCTLYTLTQFPEIKGVRIYAGDEKSEVLRPEGIITGTESLRVETRQVLLFYPDADNTGLLEVEKELTLSEADSLSEAVVEQLIAGNRFDTGFRRHIAQQTVCLSAQIKSRVCYVNLNSAFLDLNLVQKDGVSLTVYSIVDSLCMLDPIDRVQFLIDGEVLEGVMSPGFDKPMDPDYSLVLEE